MAALDFPASPTVGQTYTANGSTWTWDGVSWVSSNDAVSQIVAGTNITISPAGGTGAVTVNASGGGAGGIEVGDGAIIPSSGIIVQRGSQYFQAANRGLAYNATYHDLTNLPGISKQYGTNYSFGFPNVAYTSIPTWDGSKWLVINQSATVTNQLATSTDGQTWTVSSTGINASLSPTELFFVNGKYFAFSAGSNFASSTDGVIWTYYASGGPTCSTNQRSLPPYWTGSQYVFQNPQFTIFRSADGITWTNTSLTGDGIAYNGSLFVGVGTSAQWRTSPDGTTWTSRIAPFTLQAHAIGTNGTDFFVINRGGNSVYKSSDGITWTIISEFPVGVGFQMRSNFRYISGTFYVWGNLADTVLVLYKSTDNCVTWSPVSFMTSSTTHNYLVNNGSYFLNVGTSLSSTSFAGATFASTVKTTSFSGTPINVFGVSPVYNTNGHGGTISTTYMRTK